MGEERARARCGEVRTELERSESPQYGGAALLLQDNHKRDEGKKEGAEIYVILEWLVVAERSARFTALYWALLDSTSPEQEGPSVKSKRRVALLLTATASRRRFVDIVYISIVCRSIILGFHTRVETRIFRQLNPSVACCTAH